MPNCHNLEHSSHVSQRDFLSLTKFCWIRGAQSAQEQFCGPSLCGPVWTGWETNYRLQLLAPSICKRYWRMLSLISLCSSGAAADPKNQWAEQEPCLPNVWRHSSCVYVKVLTSFPEDYGRINFFQVQEAVMAFTASLRLNKRNVKHTDAWSVENIQVFLRYSQVTQLSLSCLEVCQWIVVFNVQK